MANIVITQQLVKELFDYHEDGYLFWKIKAANRVNIGDKAGNLNKRKTGDRYVVSIKNKRYLIARIIFLWHNGHLPPEVDHEDNNPLNNRNSNLRAATHAQNSRNKTSAKNSSSKYLGVDFDYRQKKWRAQIHILGQRKHIGRYKSESEAALAYNRMAVIHHKEFANLNIIEND